jgi:hypothetical protein
VGSGEWSREEKRTEEERHSSQLYLRCVNGLFGDNARYSLSMDDSMT